MNKRQTHERLRRRADLDKGLLDRGWHSGSYRRHFEGYTEYEDTNENGKTVIRRVYVGDYYRQNLPRSKRIVLRLTYIALWLLTAVVFFFCASREIGANMTWYVAAAQFAVLVGLGWMLLALFGYLTAPRDMTIGDWKSTSRSLRRGSIVAALAVELTALLTLLHLLIYGENWGLHLLCVLGYVLSGGMAVVTNRLEANAPYLVFPSTEEAPEDGTNIDV